MEAGGVTVAGLKDIGKICSEEARGTAVGGLEGTGKACIGESGCAAVAGGYWIDLRDGS